MNIFSWLVMAYSLNMGMIVPEWSESIVQNQEVQPYFIEYGVEFIAFDRVHFETYIENIFVKTDNHIEFSPIRDTYTVKASIDLNENVNIWASHYCRHPVDGYMIAIKGINNGIQSETRIGLNLSSK